MAEIDVKARLKSDLPWIGAGFGVYLTYWYLNAFGLGVDAHAYWLAARGPLYTGAPATYDAYLYSPVFVQIVWPIAQLDWPIFLAIWMTVTTVAFIYLLWPLGWRLAVPLFGLCLPEIVTGNINWIFALVVAFGLRRPWLWSIPLLTKIAPAIGPIWFLFRRQWKNLLISVVATIVVISVSFLIDSEAWIDWIRFLNSHLGMTSSAVGGQFGTPMIRIPIAVVLVAWGAWRQRYWTLPAAMFLAAPVFSIAALVVFVGLPRLLVNEKDSDLSVAQGSRRV